MQLTEAARGFFCTGNIRMLRQLRIGLRLNIDPGAGGYIIKDHRRGNRIGNGLVMPQKALLGSLIIVGGHHQQPVCPQAFRSLGIFTGDFCGIGPGTRNDGDAACNTVDAVLYRFQPLLLCHSGCLSGSAADNDGVDTSRKLAVDQPAESGEVDRTVFKWRDNGGSNTCKESLLHSVQSPSNH